MITIFGAIDTTFITHLHIRDGLGSYPDWLEACPVFLNLRRVATHYYMLFQQQTSEQLAPFENYIGAVAPVINRRSYSFIRLAGREVAILSVDARSERTQKQVHYSHSNLSAELIL